MAARLVDRTGIRFGRLVAIEVAGRTSSGQATWRCRCDCGSETVAAGGNLASGSILSCGCYRRSEIIPSVFETGLRKLGLVAENKAWAAARRRTQDPDDPAFPHYGGRGIGMCGRWLNGEGGKHPFACFLEDMGRKPSTRHTLERSDNERGYEPGNCRWATQRDQMRNRRVNRLIVVRGQTMTLVEAVERYGKNESTVEARLRRGWSVEDALFAPPRQVYHGMGGNRHRA